MFERLEKVKTSTAISGKRIAGLVKIAMQK